jgi:hypothetical protein
LSKWWGGLLKLMWNKRDMSMWAVSSCSGGVLWQAVVSMWAVSSGSGGVLWRAVVSMWAVSSCSGGVLWRAVVSMWAVLSGSGGVLWRAVVSMWAVSSCSGGVLWRAVMSTVTKLLAAYILSNFSKSLYLISFFRSFVFRGVGFCSWFYSYRRRAALLAYLKYLCSFWM